MSNAQKTPLARTSPRFVQNKVLDEIAKRGRALPGHVIAVSGQIVTVNFDVTGATLPAEVSMPLATAEYDRIPIQIGDKGIARPAGTYLGGISGLGGGTADLSQRGNLTTLVWEPIANSSWTLPPGADANTRAIYGALATLLLDSLAGNSSVKLTSTGITLSAPGGGSITMNSSGITLTVGSHSIVISSGGVMIDGVPFLPHTHTGGTISGNTGPVIP